MAEDVKKVVIVKYYFMPRTNQFQAIESTSALGKTLKKAKNWKEITREEFYKRQGKTAPLAK